MNLVYIMRLIVILAKWTHALPHRFLTLQQRSSLDSEVDECDSGAASNKLLESMLTNAEPSTDYQLYANLNEIPFGVTNDINTATKETTTENGVTAAITEPLEDKQSADETTKNEYESNEINPSTTITVDTPKVTTLESRMNAVTPGTLLETISLKAVPKIKSSSSGEPGSWRTIKSFFNYNDFYWYKLSKDYPIQPVLLAINDIKVMWGNVQSFAMKDFENSKNVLKNDLEAVEKKLKKWNNLENAPEVD